MVGCEYWCKPSPMDTSHLHADREPSAPSCPCVGIGRLDVRFGKLYKPNKLYVGNKLDAASTCQSNRLSQ